MSEQQRVMLAIGLCLVIFIGWQVLFPGAPPVEPPKKAVAEKETPGFPEAAPTPALNALAGTTEIGGDEPVAHVVIPEAKVTFETSLLFGELTNRGPGLTQLHLKEYGSRPAEQAESSDLEPLPPGPMSLVLAERDGQPYQAGIKWQLGAAADVAPPQFSFVPSVEGTHVLVSKTVEGLEATVAITPLPGAYGLEYVLTIDNKGTAAAPVGAAIELSMKHVEQEGGLFSGQMGEASGICLVSGAVERMSAGDLDDGPYQPTAPATWAGLDKQYFVVAVIAENTMTTRCAIEMRDGNIVVHYDLGHEMLIAGGQWQRKLSLYVGPKKDEDLAAISPGLLQVIDYSIMGIPLGFIARPMIFLLKFFHGWVNSWGLAILLLTLTVKLVLFPVTYKSQVSMRKMQMLKPQLDKIKEQHPNDREKQQQAQFALYKESGVNPLGGCLPMLLQMPIWFALYRSLWTAVELYQQSFLWLPDLTAKEPGFPLLAIGLGAVFFVQQLLTPMSVDNSQAKMMKWVMPIMFTVFMFALPSGLVLYIFINSVLSILQQLAINRSIGPSPAIAPAKAAAVSGEADATRKGRGGKHTKARRMAKATK